MKIFFNEENRQYILNSFQPIKASHILWCKVCGDSCFFLLTSDCLDVDDDLAKLKRLENAISAISFTLYDAWEPVFYRNQFFVLKFTLYEKNNEYFLNIENSAAIPNIDASNFRNIKEYLDDIYDTDGFEDVDRFQKVLLNGEEELELAVYIREYMEKKNEQKR